MQNQIKLLMSGVSKMNQTGIFKAHAHPYYQLNHILRGEYEFKIDGQTVQAGVGDTILIPMNHTHSIALKSGDSGYYFEVKFTTFSKQDKDICDDAELLVKDDQFSAAVMREIFEEDENNTSSSEEIKITYLYAILYKLSAGARRRKNAPSKYIEVALYSESVKDIIRFLENNYARHLTLDDIVRETQLQKSSLCSRFKRETNVTVFECLMIIRVRKAVELLSYTDLSLAQISEATGFVSLTHFNRVFTKHVMIPPGQFRKHLASQNLYWNDATKLGPKSHIAAAALENRKIDFSLFE